MKVRELMEHLAEADSEYPLSASSALQMMFLYLLRSSA